ncbi:MAG: flagellar biosynthetic protein FliO [Gammaproteobacteria bacterium]
MSSRTVSGLLTAGLYLVCKAVPAQTPSSATTRSVAPADVMQWGVGLVFVLALFFACVWLMRRMSGLSVGGGDKMRVVGGLSLGLREKVVLLEVGKKQLVLGVTPGRIETLLVLDEADCLKAVAARQASGNGAFAQKLMHAMKGRTDD